MQVIDKVTGKAPKARNRYAQAVRENKCFSPRIVALKNLYSRKTKHKRKEYVYD